MSCKCLATTLIGLPCYDTWYNALMSNMKLLQSEIGRNFYKLQASLFPLNKDLLMLMRYSKCVGVVTLEIALIHSIWPSPLVTVVQQLI